jgi:glutamine synthetase
MKVKLEYVWLDGYTPEPNLRSKVKIVDYESIKNVVQVGKLPVWNFDGSSTNQADTGNSDRILKPVRVYTNYGFPLENSTVYVLCEVMDSEGKPHESNMRAKLNEEEEGLWFGFEQEYFIREEINGGILGHKRNILKGQGEYYCGVGHNVVGRDFVEEHLNMCLEYGIDITGTNAEVALGQWEYQVFSKGKLKGGDDLWMSRYFLYKISEKYGYHIDIHPKPLTHGEWNGSGLHTNFSNDKMRNKGGYEYFLSIFNSFASRHEEHIRAYGSNNHLRLTGGFETQSIDKFSWGVSDRGASIRVPQDTAKEWKGYVEDRRPGSNADPYKIIREVSKSLDTAEEILEIKTNMKSNVNLSGLSEKYRTITNDELLKEYQNDDNYELTDEMMESKANIKPGTQPEELTKNVKFDSLPEALKNVMMNGATVEIKPNER